MNLYVRERDRETELERRRASKAGNTATEITESSLFMNGLDVTVEARDAGSIICRMFLA